jgi:hypothetical protein
MLVIACALRLGAGIEWWGMFNKLGRVDVNNKCVAGLPSGSFA